MEETNNNQAQVTTAPKKFDTHKVFAAIGIILTVTFLILAGLWWYFWGRVAEEVDEAQTVKVSTSSSKPSTNSATKSATPSGTP